MRENAKQKLVPTWQSWLLLCLLALLTGSLLADDVTIAWDANSEPDLAGYNIYFGELTAAPQKINVGNTTTTTLEELSPGKTYYFYATAYNKSGLESEPSDQITYTVAAELGGPAMSAPQKVSGGGFILTGTGNPGHEYIVLATERLGDEWVELGTALASADGIIRLQDTAPAGPMRFYRVLAAE